MRANLAMPIQAGGDIKAVIPLVKMCFVAGLGVSERASVQIPVVSGFLAFFVSVRIRFGTLAKIASYARLIFTCTLARLFTTNLARDISLVGFGGGQVTVKGVLGPRAPIALSLGLTRLVMVHGV